MMFIFTMVRIIFHQLINDSSTKDFPTDKEITETVFLFF